jgi:hypothetical protein
MAPNDTSDQVLYLDWGDCCKYLSAIKERTEHLLNDGDYLEVLHEELLGNSADSSRTKTATKYAVQLL